METSEIQMGICANQKPQTYTLAFVFSVQVLRVSEMKVKLSIYFDIKDPNQDLDEVNI